MKSELRLILPAIVSALIATACSSDECEDNKNSLPLAGFYSSSETPQQIAVDSLTVFGAGAPGDSIIIDNASNVASVYLPFRIDQNETRFILKYNQKALRGASDFIQFNYDIVPKFVSAACGVIYEYHINSIEHSHALIDSVTVPEKVITNANRQNIRIYFRVASEQ